MVVALGQQFVLFKENQNAPRDLLSIPQSWGKTVKTFMWDHRLQIQKCSFQKESVVCEWRIGIRKGSGDVVLLSPPRGAVVRFNLPGKQAREE